MLMVNIRVAVFECTSKGDEKYIQSIFSTSLLSHFILILLLFLLQKRLTLVCKY